MTKAAQLQREIDAALAQQSLKEEREAIRVYGKRITQAESPALKHALRHALKEEREHAAMFAPLTRLGGLRPNRRRAQAIGRKP